MINNANSRTNATNENFQGKICLSHSYACMLLILNIYED